MSVGLISNWGSSIDSVICRQCLTLEQGPHADWICHGQGTLDIQSMPAAVHGISSRTWLWLFYHGFPEDRLGCLEMFGSVTVR